MGQQLVYCHPFGALATEQNRTERSAYRPSKRKRLSGGFGAENAMEAGAGELHADELFAFGLGLSDVHNATAGGEVRIVVSGGRKAADTPSRV